MGNVVITASSTSLDNLAAAVDAARRMSPNTITFDGFAADDVATTADTLRNAGFRVSIK